MKCSLCERIAEEKEFCALHSKAYENLLKKYEAWRKALKITWQEYLNEIARNQFTGQWVKEMAEHISGISETKHVEES